jgi:SH3-like domain-containing protein
MTSPVSPSSRVRRTVLRALLAGALLATGLADAARAETGRPVPRFVSLRSDDVNVRTGPGLRYPVDWVFRRRHLPVEVVAEWDTWRKVRDWEGAVGWVHQSTLSARRYAIVMAPAGQLRTLRRDPVMTAAAVAEAEPMVLGLVLECQPQWCRLDVQGRRGWLPRTDLWGLYPNEALK